MAEKPMTLEILVPDRYLAFPNQAVNCARGDVIETRVPYGQTLVDANLARPVKVASDPATAEGGAAEPVDYNIPGMNIDAVLEGIKAGDFTPEEALEAELARGKNARKTLVEALEKIIGFDEEIPPMEEPETGEPEQANDPATAEGGDEESG